MNAVTEHLRKVETETDDLHNLSTGYQAIIIPVGGSLIDDIVAGIEYPPVPTFMNEDKGRVEENPVDPAYLAARDAVDLQRANSAMEALLMLGVQLEGEWPLPRDKNWLAKLQFLERRGRIDLSQFDIKEPMDLELMFKKYVAVGTKDLIMVGMKAGLSRADVEEAAKVFKS